MEGQVGTGHIFCRNYHTCLAVYDVFDLYEKVREKIMKCVQTRPRDYMIADDVEIMLAAQAVARSRKIPFQADNRDLSYLLNQRETGIVQRLSEEYERRSRASIRGSGFSNVPGGQRQLQQNMVGLLRENTDI
jgi:hypothetical protein